MAEVLAGIDGMFFGRVAYELLAQHWPAAEHSDRPIEAEQARMNEHAAQVRAFTIAARGRLGPGPTTRRRSPGEVTQLKQQAGKDLALFAGATAISAFAAHDLIDEYRLMIFPVLLGDGIPLPPVARRRELQHADTTTFEQSGVVVLRYLPQHDRAVAVSASL